MKQSIFEQTFNKHRKLVMEHFGDKQTNEIFGWSKKEKEAKIEKEKLDRVEKEKQGQKEKDEKSRLQNLYNSDFKKFKDDMMNLSKITDTYGDHLKVKRDSPEGKRIIYFNKLTVKADMENKRFLQVNEPRYSYGVSFKIFDGSSPNKVADFWKENPILSTTYEEDRLAFSDDPYGKGEEKKTDRDTSWSRDDQGNIYKSRRSE